MLLSATLYVLDQNDLDLYIIVMCNPLSISFHGALFVLQLELLDASTVCKLNFLLSCGSPFTSHVSLPSSISCLNEGKTY